MSTIGKQCKEIKKNLLKTHIIKKSMENYIKNKKIYIK